MVRKGEVIREKLDRYRGIIISGSTEIEGALLFWLNQYFILESGRKSQILYFEVLDDLNFGSVQSTGDSPLVSNRG